MVIELVISSSLHFVLTYILCVIYDYKMLGVAFATFLHFVARSLVPIILVRSNSFFAESLIPLTDKDSLKGLREIANLGFVSALGKVMGWWAFDVFTLLAAQLSVTDIAA